MLQLWCSNRVTVAPHRLLTTTKETRFPSQRSFVCQFQQICLYNPYIRCCLQCGDLGGFVLCELNAFGRLRQALVYIWTRRLFRPPSSMHTQSIADHTKQKWGRKIRSKYQRRRLHTTQKKKNTKLSTKSMFLNGKYFCIWRVCYLVS